MGEGERMQIRLGDVGEMQIRLGMGGMGKSRIFGERRGS